MVDHRPIQVDFDRNMKIRVESQKTKNKTKQNKKKQNKTKQNKTKQYFGFLENKTYYPSPFGQKILKIRV